MKIKDRDKRVCECTCEVCACAVHNAYDGDMYV